MHMCPRALSLLCCIAFCAVQQPETLTASPVLPDHPGSTTIYFYNVTDPATAVPYMSISFSNLPEKHKATVDALRTEIDEAIKKIGGVFDDEDYARLIEVLPGYMPQFQELGVRLIKIEFPRKQCGIIVYQQ